MRAVAGPVILLVMVGGFAIYRGCASEDHPSRTFTNLEFAGADGTGSCFSLETVLFTNRMFSKATRTWETPRENAWTLQLDEITQGYGGPQHTFQKFTFEKSGDQAKLVSVDASKDLSTDLTKNVDDLLDGPNDMRSTPVDRCREGGTGYKFKPQKK